jgi:hypothetical protein
MNDEIAQLLARFYNDGRVPCAGGVPLHIAFDPNAVQVRLRGEGPSAYYVVFPEAKFVEMIERSGVPPTETLIRVWLSTLYFDTHVYAWAHRIALSEPTLQEHSRAAR